MQQNTTKSPQTPRQTELKQIHALRGFAIIVIIINHIIWATNIFDPHFFTVSLLGLVEMTEIFFLVSGISAAKAYLQHNKDRFKRILSRAAKIYIAHLITFFYAIAFTTYLPSNSSEQLQGDLGWLLLNGVLLIYRPRFIDILPLYVLFFLTLPFIIKMFESGRQKLLILGSILFWTLAQFINFYSSANSLNDLNIFAWQIVYILGFVIGSYYNSASWQNFFSKYRTALVLVCSSICAMFLYDRHIDHNIILSHLDGWLLDKGLLGPIRLFHLIIICLLALTLLPLFSRFKPPTALVLVGKHSLVTYTFSICLLFPIAYLCEKYLNNWSIIWRYAALGFYLICIILLTYCYDAYMQKRRSPSSATKEN